MPTRTNSFGLSLTNVPIVNLRLDFNLLVGMFRNEAFRRQFKGLSRVIDEIRTPQFTWYGRPALILTHLLREAIVGIESAVCTAVLFEAQDRDLPRHQYLSAVSDPLSLGGSTANCVYNKLPEIINPGYPLRLRNEALWLRVRTFYNEVRNSLFHAYEISDSDPDPVWQCLEMLREVHEWLNSWHPIGRVASGPIS